MFGILTNISVAVRNLRVNKVRSALTLLGLIIGVASVIAIITLGDGLRALFGQQIGELGADVIYAVPKAPQRAGRSRAVEAPKGFELVDVEAIRRGAPLVMSAMPVSQFSAIVKYRDKNRDAAIVATEPDYFVPGSNRAKTGREFTNAEYHARSRVAVIGDGIREDLFGKFDNPLGKRISIRGLNFEVIGVLKAVGNLGANNHDGAVIIPLSTAQVTLTEGRYLQFIILKVEGEENVEEAKGQIERVLRQRRKISDPSRDNFEIVTVENILEFVDRFVNILTIIFGSVAAVALIVGGIGIMNIMLVSVTERTREIGLRMAVGAKPSAILFQFLIEAVVLCLVGVGLGIAIGYLLALMVSLYLQAVFSANWIPTLTFKTLLLSSLTATIIGVVFGVYPAYKASRLDPITSLRYE